MYIKGVNLLKRQMKAAIKEKNNERAISLRDSVFLFYDLRIEHFPATSKKPTAVRCSGGKRWIG